MNSFLSRTPASFNFDTAPTRLRNPSPAAKVDLTLPDADRRSALMATGGGDLTNIFDISTGALPAETLP